MEIVAVPDTQGEIRLDSRSLAERMDNEHASVMKLIGKNLAHFEGFGRVGFEIQTLETRGGKQEVRFALLNEDQCYFLLTLVRNSDTTVPMKAAVVAAFSQARQLLAQPTPSALPALITARAIGESTGQSRNAVLNALSRRYHVQPVACGTDNRQPCYLFPLAQVAEAYELAGWPVAQPFQPYSGTVLRGGTRPALDKAMRGVQTRTGKPAPRQTMPRLLPQNQPLDLDQLVRVVTAAVRAALA